MDFLKLGLKAGLNFVDNKTTETRGERLIKERDRLYKKAMSKNNFEIGMISDNMVDNNITFFDFPKYETLLFLLTHYKNSHVLYYDEEDDKLISRMHEEHKFTKFIPCGYISSKQKCKEYIRKYLQNKHERKYVIILSVKYDCIKLIKDSIVSMGKWYNIAVFNFCDMPVNMGIYGVINAFEFDYLYEIREFYSKYYKDGDKRYMKLIMKKLYNQAMRSNICKLNKIEVLGFDKLSYLEDSYDLKFDKRQKIMSICLMFPPEYFDKLYYTAISNKRGYEGLLEAI